MRCQDDSGGQKDAVTLCLIQVNRLLREASEGILAETSPHAIFKVPPPLRGVNRKAVEPEVVSIGPYHHGRPQVLEFEKLKPRFLQMFLRRTGSDLELLTRAVADQERYAWTLYSEPVNMTRADFVQMMLLDGCFVVALLLHIYKGDDTTPQDPIFTRPEIIPSLIRDLLKLENQIPYSLLRPVRDPWRVSNLAGILNASMSSGIKFKPKKADSFLDISSRKPVLRKPFVTIEDFMAIVLESPVLEIPDIAINDFMTTVLINCVSLEQCRQMRSKYMTDYIYFMHCLIKQPKDVSLLRSDGIIASFSHDDEYVADLFDKLGKSISFNVNGCFLSELFGELDKYYRSNWANMMRTYFSSPWSIISAFTAFLIIVFTITQTVFAILTYRFRR
ncbi:hypothetical protein NL676_034087 [Syzygium grande]|nr:hypothetical protein NL676_034087 [Syzygium grande]